MGSDPADQPPATTRRIDAAGAVNVQRLLDGAARSDGFDGLSDQLAADLEELLGGRNARQTVAVGVSEQAGADAESPLVGVAVASPSNGDWTMQVVIDPRRRHATITRNLVEQLLSEILLAGGQRVDWWVYAPTEVEDSIANELGFRAERRLLQMRRAIPAERRADVATRSFQPDRDEQAWLTVNNRAFAGHHEQSGWTLDTLRQRMRQPWFNADDLRLHERDGRLAAFCWTKRHDAALYEIYVIGVDPDYQGRGLGSQLTLAGLDHMVTRGASTALLYVAAENTAATRMYERLGFTVQRFDQAYVAEVSTTDR